MAGDHTFAEAGTYNASAEIMSSSGVTLFPLTAQVEVDDADLYPGSSLLVYTAVNRSVADQPIGYFTDDNPNPGAHDFTATIDWGDGTTDTASETAGTIVQQANGSVAVFGGHSYVNGDDFPGDNYFPVTIIVQDVDGSSTEIDSGASEEAADPDLSIQAMPIMATEGAFTGTVEVAAFIDDAVDYGLIPAADPHNYTVKINWGDGSSGPGTVQLSSDGFTFIVQASHTYEEEGTYQVTVYVTDITGTGPAQVSTTAEVGDAALTAAPAPVTGTQGQPLGGVTLATFTDASPYATLGDFTASVLWGDEQLSDDPEEPGPTPEAATVTTGSGGSFLVSANHAYQKPGTYTATVDIYDVGGSTEEVQVPVTIAGALPTITGLDTTWVISELLT